PFYRFDRLSRKVGFYTRVDIVQYLTLIRFKRRTIIPFDTACSLAFFEITNKFTVADLIRHQHLSYLDHNNRFMNESAKLHNPESKSFGRPHGENYHPAELIT